MSVRVARIKKVSPPVSITSANTPTTVYAITPGRKAYLKKIWAVNTATSPITFSFVQQTPSGPVTVSIPITINAGQQLFLDDRIVLEIPFVGAVQVTASAAGLVIQVEVEEELLPAV